MTVRDRYRQSLMSQAGQSRLYGWADLTDDFPAVVMSSRCVDVVDGTRDNHPLFVSHYTPVLFWIHGVSHDIPGAPEYRWEYNGRPVYWTPSIDPPSTAEPSNNRSLTTALARTNPNKPSTDLLQFIGELRDLPKMVKDVGDTWIRNNKGHAHTSRNLAKDIGSGTIGLEFGWIPFVKDLLGLLDFEASVSKKLKTLQKLRDKGSSGGSAVVWEDVVQTEPGEHYLTSLWNESNKVNLGWVSTRKKWASCVWKPSVPLPPQSDDGDRNLAFRLAYGTDISLAVMWELMPWSWLIDWFSNIGDLASLSRNTIPVSNTGSCVMLKSECRVKYFGKVPGAGTGRFYLEQPRTAPYTTKERWVMDNWVPLPEFNLPFLNGKQLGILASLTLAKKGGVRLS